MKLISENINNNQINIYLISSLFLVTISFFITKSFISSEELSDNIFSISCILAFEVAFLVLINNLKNFIIEKKSDFLLYFILFSLILFLWNYQISKDSLHLLYFISFQILVATFMILTEYKTNELKNVPLSVIFSFLILSCLCSGLFYQIESNNFENITTIIIFAIFYFILLKIFKHAFNKKNSFLDLMISITIFLILLKIFLLSAEKDSFHYSWYLGPAYSSFVGNSLLIDTVSQYGYFSILFIEYFSTLIQSDLDTAFIVLIVSFFLIFFLIFFKTISGIIRYPYFILITFSCLLIFGLIGISNLSGAMFIASSSVYRFLPSLLAVFFLSRIIISKNKEKNFYFNSICFFLFLTLSIGWSFESFFFVIFSILSLFFPITLNFLYLEKKNKNLISIFFKKKKHLAFFIFLATLSILFIFIISFNKNLTFFYEYALTLEGVKTLQILNTRTSLLFIFFLLINFLILRLSFNHGERSNFFYNFLWFSLFISFSSYFIVRSHPNNIFALLPFFIFFTCILKISSNDLNNFRKIFLKIFMAFTIISSISSIYFNEQVFVKNFFSKTYIQTPIYKYKNYKPSKLIEDQLAKYKELPVTLITGSEIHNFNEELNAGGFGLPILPLEQFNILSSHRKEFLISKFFKKNSEHIILCLIDCNFYSKKKKRKTWEDIYLSKNIKVRKIVESKKNKSIEILYLLRSE